MTVSRTIEFQNTRGWRLRGSLRAVERDNAPVVVIAHNVGSNRHTPSYRPVTERSLERGINVLALDLSGHGESEGRYCDGPEQYARDIAEASAFVRQTAGFEHSPIGLAGSGRSGTAALYAMAALDLPARTAVLRAPPLYRYERLPTQITSPCLVIVGSMDPLLASLQRALRSFPEGSD
ncbi:MAG: alpha/beta hydrolase, partial [Chloroflexota bacterium]